MVNAIKLVFILVIFSVSADPERASAFSENNQTYYLEEFNSLAEWRDMSFVSIKNHTIYSITAEGGESYLKCESNASASGLVFSRYYNIREYPKLKWRWKISNVYEKGDVTKKEGDDYPVRLIIMFRYDPAESAISKRLKYGIVKGLYGSYPPDTALVYIWANRKDERGTFTSAYANEEKIVVLQQGSEKAGQWIEEEVNVLEDYRRAFGTDPPSEAGIAIINDSDNTGERSVSFIDYIEIFR